MTNTILICVLPRILLLQAFSSLVLLINYLTKNPKNGELSFPLPIPLSHGPLKLALPLRRVSLSCVSSCLSPCIHASGIMEIPCTINLSISQSNAWIDRSAYSRQVLGGLLRIMYGVNIAKNWSATQPFNHLLRLLVRVDKILLSRIPPNVQEIPRSRRPGSRFLVRRRARGGNQSELQHTEDQAMATATAVTVTTG